MMKRLCSFCALFLLLVTSISTYAGVTDGDVTAYRLANVQAYYVVFTNTKSDDPNSTTAPLGIGLLDASTCDSTAGSAVIGGLVCNGASGDPVADYSCTTVNLATNASNTTWCLFSENPRTGGKAWAVKYVGGYIPTNDGASIVRCEGTDIFDGTIGCTSLPPVDTSQDIAISEGYIKLDTTDGKGPPYWDCSDDAHQGRMVVDDVNDTLYICTDSGWKTTVLAD
jgi:hypothetical protein